MLKLKKYNKPIAKAVGADASVRPHFEEPTLKTPKACSNLISNLQPLTSKAGITLIALIITIIVMLILVGVTINVALNGGLFEKAKTATQQTEKEVILEEIIDCADWDDNGKIKVKETLEEFAKKFVKKYNVTPNTVGEEALEVTIKVQGKNGTYNYKISETEIKILDNSGTGGDFPVSSSWVDNGNGTYTKGEKTVSKGTELSSQEVYQMLGIPDVGDDKYNGTWEVLGIEGGKLKLVSTSNVENDISLGFSDPRATNENVDGHLNPGATNYEIAVWSCAHAVQTLNQAVKEATGIDSARSLIIEDIYDALGGKEEVINNLTSTDKQNYGRVYKYYFEDTAVYSKNKATANEEYPEGDGNNTYLEEQTFVVYPHEIKENSVGTIYKINSESSETVELTNNYYSYTLNEEQKDTLGSLAQGYFWFASPCIKCSSSGAGFWIYFFGENGINYYYDELFSSGGSPYVGTSGVRAIVYI